MTGGRANGSLRPALLNPCYWPEVRRGAERFARELATGLIARGHEPALITSHPSRPAKAVEEGLNVIRNWRPPDGPVRRRGFHEYLTHVPFSYLSLRTGKYDLAHALYLTDALAAVRWSERSGRPSILSYMGIPDQPDLRARRRKLELMLRVVHRADAVVALSEVAARAFRRMLHVEARVINPGVDLRAFAPGGERSAEPTILCASDVSAAHKRLELLIAAARLVRRDLPDLRLVLSRPSDASLASAITANDQWIELADLDRQPALASAYREAWVTVLPSWGEAFGLVLIEALACGTPVVASNNGGMPEVVDSDAVGRLFDGEERALADALLEALELAREPATAAACRARAEGFSTDRCVEAYEALYRELLERGSAPPPVGRESGFA